MNKIEELKKEAWIKNVIKIQGLDHESEKLFYKIKHNNEFQNAIKLVDSIISDIHD